ncbi:MAG: hypothetical protein OQL20_08835 [Sedimenticola sp.]|nr:hypothetical protein [Sedimenticola sp.]
MKERVSEFPDRPTVTRGSETVVDTQVQEQAQGAMPLPSRKAPKHIGRLIVLGFMLFWLYNSGWLHALPAWLDEGYRQLEVIWRNLERPLSEQTRPATQNNSTAERVIARAEKPVPIAVPDQVVTPAPIRLSKEGQAMPVSIGLGFAPVGFKIGARSKTLTFSSRPGLLHRRLPPFQGPGQKYGSIDLANGRRHAYVLDTDPKGYRLYVDLNRNGDLTDDGKPLSNRGKGRFANRLILPLDSVSGIPQLKGDMELWIYTNDQSWRQDALRFYNRTQLAGQLLIKGQSFNAFLADNRVIDGDYRNDGISIDINGDGKIDPRSEFVSPGDPVTLNGETLRFNIIR